MLKDFIVVAACLLAGIAIAACRSEPRRRRAGEEMRDCDGYWAGVLTGALFVLLMAVVAYGAVSLMAGRAEGAPAPLARKQAPTEPPPVGAWLVRHQFGSDCYSARMRFFADGTFDVTHEGSAFPDHSGLWRIDREAGVVWLDYGPGCEGGLSFGGDRFEYPYGTITRVQAGQ